MTTASTEIAVQPDLTPRSLRISIDPRAWAIAWNASDGLSERLGLLHDIFGTDGNYVTEESVRTLIGLARSEEGPDMPYWAAIRMKAMTMLVRRVLKPASVVGPDSSVLAFLRDRVILVIDAINLFAEPLQFYIDIRLPWRDEVVGFLMWCNKQMRWDVGRLTEAIKAHRAQLFKAMLRFGIDDVGRNAVLSATGNEAWVGVAKADLEALRRIIVDENPVRTESDWLKAALTGFSLRDIDRIRHAAAKAYASLKGVCDAAGIKA